MQNKLLILIVLWAAINLVSCANKQVVSDAALKPYLDRFVEYSKAHRAVEIEDLVVEFGETTKPAVGLCYTYGDGRSPRIVIDPDYWKDANESEREVLMFHELGHCVLYRPHRTETDISGKPLSIMYPYILYSWIYGPNKPFYHKELFTGQAGIKTVIKAVVDEPHGDWIHED